MLRLEAYQIAEQINIKRFKADFKKTPLASTSVDLFYRLDNGSYLCVFGYGIVVFGGQSEVEKSGILIFIKEYCEGIVESEFKDDFTVEISPNDEFKWVDNTFQVKELNEHVIQIVMLNLAQSVALDYFEDICSHILNENKGLTDELERRGRLKISKTNLLKFIGRVLNVKNSIIDNLYIFDAPDIVWENEYLEKVDDELKKSFDITLRYKDVDYKLKILQENLVLFTDLLHNRQSHNLEIIIIVLIMIEVLHLFLSYIF